MKSSEICGGKKASGLEQHTVEGCVLCVCVCFVCCVSVEQQT